MTARKKQSWRDVLPVHPAADVFPLMKPEELKELAKNIRETGGLEQKVLIWDPFGGEESLLDGRNRLDAMELLGWETVKDGKLISSLCEAEGGGSISAETVVIGLNIRRRHLTKSQQVSMITKVLTAVEGFELAKVAKSKPRSHRPTGNTKGGSTKDPLKEKVLEEAAKQGISKRTAERALADAKKEEEASKKPAPKKTAAPAAAKPAKKVVTGEHDLAVKQAARDSKKWHASTLTESGRSAVDSLYSELARLYDEFTEEEEERTHG